MLELAVLVVSLLLGLLALGAALAKRINRAAREAVREAEERTHEQLATNNGHTTVGRLVESSAQKLDELIELSQSNRQLAQTAIRLAVNASEEIREHRTVDHRIRTGKEKTDVDG